jgi:hypothetical protein
MIGIGIGVGRGGTAPLGLLDTYPNAAAAYSVRKLRNAYTGNAIRVRRSSDNTEQNIGFDVNGNLDTTALTTFCSSTDGFVTTWYDQSTNGNNATQSTAANQPQIVSSGSVLLENSKPTLYHPANKEWFGFSTQINTINFTVLWVSRRLTTSGGSSIIVNGVGYLGDDVNNGGVPNGSNQVTGIIGTAYNNTSSSGLQTSQHLSYANKRNITEAVGQFNNSNNPYNNSVHPNFIGFHAIATYSPGFNYAGYIQEIIIYTNDQSTNRTGISTNINTYYAIY